MAGSFGYDSEYYEYSKKMAHLSLIPTLKNEVVKDEIIVANGISCRQQIFDFSNKKAKHVSELLFKIIEKI